MNTYPTHVYQLINQMESNIFCRCDCKTLCHPLPSLSLHSTQCYTCLCFFKFASNVFPHCYHFMAKSVEFYEVFFPSTLFSEQHGNSFLLCFFFLVSCTPVEFAQATPLPFSVCSTTHGSQIDKWTMDHMETHKAIHQEQFLKISNIFGKNQYPQELFGQANSVPHFLKKPYIFQFYPIFVVHTVKCPSSFF